MNGREVQGMVEALNAFKEAPQEKKRFSALHAIFYAFLEERGLANRDADGSHLEFQLEGQHHLFRLKKSVGLPGTAMEDLERMVFQVWDSQEHQTHLTLFRKRGIPQIGQYNQGGHVLSLGALLLSPSYWLQTSEFQPTGAALSSPDKTWEIDYRMKPIDKEVERRFMHQIYIYDGIQSAELKLALLSQAQSIAVNNSVVVAADRKSETFEFFSRTPETRLGVRYKDSWRHAYVELECNYEGRQGKAVIDWHSPPLIQELGKEALLSFQNLRF